jgi:hypothetical protein
MKLVAKSADKLWSSTFGNVLQAPVTSCYLGLKAELVNLFPDPLNLLLSSES